MKTTDPDAIFSRAETLCLRAVRNPALLPRYQEALKEAQSLEHNGWKKRNNMTQNQIILKHLRKAGSITVREAMVEYSVASLTKRIQELREYGHDIVSHVKTHPITGQKYTRYAFTREADYYGGAA